MTSFIMKHRFKLSIIGTLILGSIEFIESGFYGVRVLAGVGLYILIVGYGLCYLFNIRI